MNPERKCPRCGHPLSAKVLQGLCPNCLAKGFGKMPPGPPNGDLDGDEDDEAITNAEETAQDLEMNLGSPIKPAVFEQPGDHIGPYKLLEIIGEGGMGTVWMAERTEPIHQRVALKIIKPGMDSKEIIARFEAERQAVALMDHPNIAKVLDAGATSQGRPYFVMELVKGIPITQYCDEHCLTIRQRLELFIQVCQAVQHAHQKAIIHRDLKPSNVLVAESDGRPVTKVIDFGIAKAMGQPLTEHTLHTNWGQMLGTLQYMAPEQAELNQLDIDTRSDIYSLGVLLYELLTGSTPLERETLKKAAFEEVLKRIREEESQKPSLRLRTSRDRLPAISAQRKLEPLKLTKLVRGDLDWIVMMALDKDRQRRYGTANDFVLDIQNYLENRPVKAGPPGIPYRMRKFVRRNRLAVTTTTGLVAFLFIGLLVSLALLEQRKRKLMELRVTYMVMEGFRTQLYNQVIQNLNGLWSGSSNFIEISSSQLRALLLPGLSPSEFVEHFPPVTLIREEDPRCLKLTMGFNVDDKPDEEATKLAPLVNYLERTMPRYLNGRPVKISLIFFRSYEESREAQVNGRVDFFRTGVLNFLQAQQRNPRIRALIERAKPGKVGVFFTKTNSGINSISDFISKRIALGDTNSTVTFMGQRLLMKNGIVGTNLHSYEFLDSYTAYQAGLVLDEGEQLSSFVKVIDGVQTGLFDVGVSRLDYLVNHTNNLVAVPGSQFECSPNPYLAKGGIDPAVANAFCEAMISLPPYGWRDCEYRRVAPGAHAREHEALELVRRCFPIKDKSSVPTEHPSTIRPSDSQ